MKPINVRLSKPPQSSFKFKKIQKESLEFNWHYHPEYEIMFMYKSRGKRFVGDNIDYYQEGDLFFIGPNLPHTWYSPPGANSNGSIHEAILVQFKDNMNGIQFRQIPEFISIVHLFSIARRGLQFFGKTREEIVNLLFKIEHLDGADRLLTLLKILDIMGHADKSERKILSSIEFTNRFQEKEQSRIDKVCTYINQNYKKKLKLEDVAAIANMSTTAFSRFFKKSTGKTFVNYVNELRIGWACKLLIETEMTIAEICYEVGFNNLSNFNRRFYERHKMSPRQYRQSFGAKL